MPTDTTEPKLRPPTAPELRIIQLVAEGNTNKQIGAALEVAEDTVKAHLRRLFTAWSVATRIELIRVAKQQGWLVCPDCGPAVASPARLRAAADALRKHAMSLDVLASQIAADGGNHG